MMRKFCKIAALLFLVSASSALADSTFYVDTDCANDGDGTSASCAASPGATGAYNTLASFDSNRATDLVTATAIYTVYCTGATADGNVDFATDWTTSSTYYIKVVGSDTHGGTWNTGTYRLSSDDYNATARVQTTYVWFHNVQLENTYSGTDGRRSGFWFDTGGGKITNSIIRKTGTNRTLLYAGILYDNHSGTLVAANNIIYGWWDGMSITTDGGGTYAIYNNTSADNDNNGLGYSRYGSGQTIYTKNNLLTGNGAADYSSAGVAGTNTTATNITSDATSPDGASYQSKTITYNGAADYHTSDSDSVDAGSDLSAADVYSFSDDIDGDTRSGSWDVGADENVASGLGALGVIIIEDY